jgi:hypothetical protein
VDDRPPAPFAPPHVVDWITATVGRMLADGRIDPAAVLFLVRRYRDTLDGSLRGRIEEGLTAGLAVGAADGDPRERCAWLGVLAEAATVTVDPRIDEAIRRDVPSAIDALEGLCRRQYEPGQGLLGQPLIDQVLGASALLTAFDLTGRLAYPMLAEELVRYARRAAWDDAAGAFRGGFPENVVGAHVLCRLAVLHLDADYMSSAIVAAPAAYLDDARRTLLAASGRYREFPESAAHYGLALLDCFALTARPN